MTAPAAPDRQSGWSSQLARIGAEHGFYDPLDGTHKALFVRGDDTLVVTFDNLDDARQDVAERLPWGVKFINSQGWSALGIGAHGWTWYRSPAVYDFFDRLRDQSFFNQFRRVVFYGASMAGYAAAAFSSAAPGATVIALSPQATLDRAVTTGWETRYRLAWRHDFSGRYGYAPDQVQSAERMWLLFDPLMPIDASHAALFRGAHIHKIRCRHFGHNTGTALKNIDALKPFVTECVTGQASLASVYRLMRARRMVPWYQKLMLQKLQQKGRADLLHAYCSAVVRQSHPQRRPHFLNEANLAAARLGRPPLQPPA
ncbi:phosphoadenosine phosphosulfate reductase [Paracoccus sp. p4-l81]|uniref:phosphoadenosine phosphosulfate reductase n=1 Tax=Paracoccus sp. p4-l81 TaxID=3342806 RepID=UPI0035B89617